MNRDHILENNLIGRYVAGELSAAESERFELAYFHDHELAGLVEAEQTLQSEFRQKAGGATHGAPAGASVWTKWALASTIAGAFAILPVFYFLTQGDAAFELAGNPPSASTSLHALEQQRGSLPSLAVSIPPDPEQRVAFSIPVSEANTEVLTLTLLHESGDVVWTDRWSGQPLGGDPLFLSVAASELIPGVYELTVAGPESGTTVYRFRTYLDDLN